MFCYTLTWYPSPQTTHTDFCDVKQIQQSCWTLASPQHSWAKEVVAYEEGICVPCH